VQKRKSGWTPERRARQSMRIKIWAPWTRSTGPKTAAGKAKSARNAYKNGGHKAAMRMLNEALTAQNRCRLTILKIHRLWKNGARNELLKPLRHLPALYDHIFYIRLLQYCYLDKILQSEPPPRRNRCNFTFAAV